MKVIDLLNKIANGEEVPKEIIFENYRYHKQPEGYFRSVINSNWIALTTDFNIYDILNGEVEIIEEDNKDNFTGWKMYQDGKEVCSIDCSTNEEKKIPEKLKIEQDTPNSNYYIRNENGTKCGLTKHSKMIIETLNQVIDYLKSKGD